MVLYILIGIYVILAGIVVVRRIMGFYVGLPAVLGPLLCAGMLVLISFVSLYTSGNLPAQRTVEGVTGQFEVVRYSNWLLVPFDALRVERVES